MYIKSFLSSFFLFFAAAPRHVAVTNGSGRTGTTTELSCTFEGRPLPNIKWLAFGGDLTQVSKKANFSFLHYCIRTLLLLQRLQFLLNSKFLSSILQKMIVKKSSCIFGKQLLSWSLRRGFSKQDYYSEELLSTLLLLKFQTWAWEAFDLTVAQLN